MQETWRWFGPQDPIPLEAVSEAGATGIVTALHQIPGGTAWDDAAVAERKAKIEAAGLRWSVVESIPVTNAIKARSERFEEDIAAWKDTVAALGRAGITTVCYNFMPILDWTRTDIAHGLRGGKALRFDIVDVAAYDVFILRRQHAADSYPADVLAAAQKRAEAMSEARIETLETIVLAGLPGSDFSYDRGSFMKLIDMFDGMSESDLSDNLSAFLNAVVPVAEEFGVRLAIHPDDPPFPIFGLRRIVSTADGVQAVLDAVDSPSNGLTFCVGSYSSRPDNDVPAMLARFASRVHFLHLRNVIRESDQVFHESEHLDGDTDMLAVIGEVLREEGRRKAAGREDDQIPMRPDHGHLLSLDPLRNTNPGYSYIGRLKGLAEIRGAARAIAASTAGQSGS